MTTIIEKRCRTIVDYLKEHGNTHEVALSDLDLAIRAVAGYRRETIKQYIDALVFFKLVKRKTDRIFVIVDEQAKENVN